jgi:hypothetical protein
LDRTLESIGLLSPSEIGLFLGLRLWGKKIGLSLGLTPWSPKQIGLSLGLGLSGPK